ncbi:MAG: hypothetical protein ACLPVY_09790 [Acidimicrobiia bacterium]
MAVGLTLTVALLAGCSSTSPTARQLGANITSTSAAPPTTAVPKSPTLECPIHAPTVIAKHQQPGTASTFVPGRPVALLACRYHGYNQPEPIGSLAGSAHFAPGPFVTALNTARLVPKRAYNCPLDAGERMLVIFAYDNGTRLTASIETMGCGFATNGDRSVFNPTAMLEHLEAVLGHDRG